jgi:hypothetical protein
MPITMQSTKDAERVVELARKREAIHKLAGDIRMSDKIGSAGRDESQNRHVEAKWKVLTFRHFADELNDLVKREAAAQIAKIDAEIRSLGVEPDEFEAAAPAEETRETDETTRRTKECAAKAIPRSKRPIVPHSTTVLKGAKAKVMPAESAVAVVKAEFVTNERVIVVPRYK